MAKAKEETRKSKAADANFYTKLIIYRRRQISLALILGIYFFLFASLLYKDIGQGKPWLLIAIPVTIAGLLLIFFPSTEEWEYKPWQNNKQKQERLFLN